VKDVLCNDAPEGYIPDEVNDEVNITTKDILSYSWRALKEASSLIRVLVSKAPISETEETSILRKGDLEILSRLCFTELAELRHRGAFSSVAQAYAACCSRNHTSGYVEVLDSLFRVSMAR
jgi:hypothetical protein